MTPVEAVEAATKALIKAWGYETDWDEGTSADIRIALEAAAPFIQERAWDEGWDAFANFDSRPRGPYPANPYRSEAERWRDA